MLRFKFFATFLYFSLVGEKKKLKTITNCFHFITETGAPVWSTDFKRYSLSSLLGFDSESESFFLRCSLPFSPDHWGRSRPVMDGGIQPTNKTNEYEIQKVSNRKFPWLCKRKEHRGKKGLLYCHCSIFIPTVRREKSQGQSGWECAL